jgi:hypothetical protein
MGGGGEEGAAVGGRWRDGIADVEEVAQGGRRMLGVTRSSYRTTCDPFSISKTLDYSTLAGVLIIWRISFDNENLKNINIGI